MLFLRSLPKGDGFRLHTSHLLPEQGKASKLKLSLPSELHLGKPAALLSPVNRRRPLSVMARGARALPSSALSWLLAGEHQARASTGHLWDARVVRGCRTNRWHLPVAAARISVMARWGFPCWRVLGCWHGVGQGSSAPGRGGKSQVFGSSQAAWR